jgi:hypothetical protein
MPEKKNWIDEDKLMRLIVPFCLGVIVGAVIMTIQCISILKKEKAKIHYEK